MWRRIGWCIFAASALLPLALATLPMTGWSVRQSLHLALVLTIKPGSGWEHDDAPDYSVEESVLAYPPLPDGADPGQHLAHLLDMRSHSNLEALHRASLSSQGTPLICTAYLLSRMRMLGAPPDTRTYSTDTGEVIAERAARARDQIRRYSDDWKAMVVVCRRGAATEPANAFFPLLAARLSNALGFASEMRRFLLTASKCATYEDHRFELNDLLTRQRVRQFGYRGQWTAVLSRALPDTRPWLSSFPAEVERLGDRAATSELIACGDVIYRSARTLDQLVTARAMLLGPLPREGISTGQSRFERTRTMAVSFDPSPSFVQKALEASVSQRWVPSRQEDDLSIWNRLTDPEMAREYPYDALGAIVGTVAAALLAGLGWLAARTRWNGPPAAALPALATCIWTFTDSWMTHGWSGSENLLPLAFCYAAITAGCWTERTRRWSLAAGIVVPVLIIAFETGFIPDRLQNNGGPYEAIPLILYAVLLGRYLWIRWRARPANRWLMPSIALGSAGALTGMSLAQSWGVANIGPWQFVLILFVVWISCLAAWQSASPSEAGRQLARPLPMIAACGSLFFSAFIALDVASDNHARSYLAGMSGAAAEARVWAHANWERPIP